MSKISFPKLFSALPSYFGGKRRLLQWIFKHLTAIVPKSKWQDLVFLDAFAGGCSVSLFAKALGFRGLLTNDWSERTQIIFQALLMNKNVHLTKEDLLWLSQPLPENAEAFIQGNFVPHILSTRHSQALDRILYWSGQYQDPIKQNLALLLMWHLVHEYVCMPTSINTSNHPYAETLDGKIPEELWFRKNEEYKREMAQIEESLRQHNKANFDYVECGVRILELAKNAYRLYKQQSTLQQQRILNFTLSNCTLKAGKVNYTYKKPFNLIAEGVSFEKASTLGIYESSVDLVLETHRLYLTNQTTLAANAF